MTILFMRQFFLNLLCRILPALLWTVASGALALDPSAPMDGYRHERWGELEGAPRFVDTLAQTEDGWLWVASRESGLYRFDGVRFHPYVARDGSRLPDTAISVLRPGPGGTLWIGHGRGGVTLLRDGRYRQLLAASTSGSVFAISLGSDGAAWIAGWGGLFRSIGDRVERIGPEQGYGGARAEHVLADRAGRVWAVDGASIYLRASGEQRFRRVRDAGADAMLLEARDGSVWLVIDKRFERVAPPTAATIGPAPGRSSSFQSLFDAHGNLWSGNCPVGLCVLRPAAWRAGSRFTPVGAAEKLDQPWQMTSLTVLSLMEDRDGSIWIGTPAGLERLRDQAVRMDAAWYDRGIAVPALHPDGSLYVVQVSRYEGAAGLMRIENGRAVALPNSLGARALDGAPDGSLVIAGDRGIERHRPGQVERIPLPAAVSGAGPSGRIKAVTAGARDVWLWTGHLGLWHYRDGSWSSSAEARDRQAGAMAYDAAGRSYHGYRGDRLRIVDGRASREFGPGDGVDVGGVEYIDPGAPLLIAGPRGVQVLVDGRFRHLRFAPGQALGAVSGIAVDRTGVRWLNAERGIFRVEPADWARSMADPAVTVHGTLFDALDGYTGGAATTLVGRTALAGPDGTLWFAGERGLASIDPRGTGGRPPTPDVDILSLGAGQRRYAAHGRIALEEGTEDIQIEYASPSLRMPQRVRFRYRLVENGAWVDAGPRRTAFFQRLRPGEHVFEVQAFNERGVPSRISTLRFDIAPHMTQTWWFNAGAVLAGALLAIFLYRLRMRQLAARIEDRFLARVRERESIARTLHDTFLQSVQGMLLSMQAATVKLSADNPLRTELDRLIGSARGVLAEGRDEIQGLRENFGNAATFWQALMRDLDAAVPGGSLQRIEAIEPDLLEQLGTVALSRDLYAILREAIINALQHTGGKIRLDATPDGRQLVLSVRDTGTGLGRHAHRKPGHFGLQGMRERAEQIGAKLRIRSDDAGTTVSIALPATRSRRQRRGDSSLAHADAVGQAEHD